VFFFTGLFALKPILAQALDGAIDLLKVDPGIEGVLQKHVKSSNRKGQWGALGMLEWIDDRILGVDQGPG